MHCHLQSATGQLYYYQTQFPVACPGGHCGASIPSILTIRKPPFFLIVQVGQSQSHRVNLISCGQTRICLTAFISLSPWSAGTQKFIRSVCATPAGLKYSQQVPQPSNYLCCAYQPRRNNRAKSAILLADHKIEATRQLEVVCTPWCTQVYIVGQAIRLQGDTSTHPSITYPVWWLYYYYHAIVQLPQVSTIVSKLDVMDNSIKHVLGSSSMSSIQHLHRTAMTKMPASGFEA